MDLTGLPDLAEEMRAVADANPFDPVAALAQGISREIGDKVMGKYRRDLEWGKYRLRFQMTKALQPGFECWTFSIGDMDGKTLDEEDIETMKKVFLGSGQIYEQKSVFRPGVTRIFFTVSKK